MPLDPFFTTSHIFHRSFAQKPRHVVSQSGLLLTLEDHDGSDTTTTTILDATGGPAVACLGHTPPAEVTTAITAQLARASYLFTGGGYSESTTEALAAHVLLAGGDAPGGGLTKAVFVGSGSEATDAALKLAAQYWRAAGQPRRARVVARRQSYHGNTLGALAVTGHEGRRAVYAPWMPGNVSFVDACYGYRGRRTEEGETDEAYVARLRAQLVGEFERLGRDTVAAFIAETVGGSTLACVPAVPGYFKMVREVCDEYGVLLILDEVSILLAILPRCLYFTATRGITTERTTDSNTSPPPPNRSCAAWAGQEQRTPGSMKASAAPTYKPSANPSAAASSRSPASWSTSASSTP